jgi:hypothetical protein
LTNQENAAAVREKRKEKNATTIASIEAIEETLKNPNLDDVTKQAQEKEKMVLIHKLQ